MPDLPRLTIPCRAARGAEGPKGNESLPEYLKTRDSRPGLCRLLPELKKFLSESAAFEGGLVPGRGDSRAARSRVPEKVPGNIFDGPRPCRNSVGNCVELVTFSGEGERMTHPMGCQYPCGV